MKSTSPCTFVLDEIVQQQTTNLIHKLTSARHKEGMSLRELSEATGISFQNLSRFENGKINPTLKTLLTVVAALQVELVIKD